MAVFTPVTTADAKAFLDQYTLGPLTSIHGIAEGVENSNFMLQAGGQNYILTLFEGRSDVTALPYFMDLMQHVHSKNIACPLPIKAKNGKALQTLNQRSAVISSFLQGTSITEITASHCAKLGSFLAQFHKATADFPQRRQNHVALAEWQEYLTACLPKVSFNEQAFINQELEFAYEHSLKSLPQGTIHADLYPDNLFFKDDKISGVIDFYFCCFEALIWDIAICINGWCFKDNQYQSDLVNALLQHYNNERSFTKEEQKMLTIACRLAAIRIYATRLHDWYFSEATAAVGKKDPAEAKAQIEYYRTNEIELSC